MVAEALLIELINESLGFQDNKTHRINLEDLEAVVKLAKEHHLLNLIYNRLSDTAKLNSIDIRSLRLLENSIMVQYKSHKMYELLKRICLMFNESNIRYIVLKGFQLAELYPRVIDRAMSDIDIYVLKEDFDKALNLLKNLGMSHKEDIKHDVMVYEQYYVVELHRMLIEYRILNLETKYEANIIGNTYLHNDGKIEYTVLANNENMIYMLLHMITHLKNACFGLKQIIDLALFMKKNTIDYDYIESIMSEMKLTNAYKHFLYMSHILFGVNISNRYMKEIPKNAATINALMKLIIENGAHGFADDDSTLMYIHRTYFDERLNGFSSNRVTNFIRFFFPRRERLTDHYRYAKENVLFLPIAWIHRFTRYIFRKDLDHRTKLFFFYADRDQMVTRDKLLKKMEL